MTDIKGLQRLFGGGCCGNNNIWIILMLIIGAVLLMGGDLIEWLLCEDMALIWIVLIVLLLTSFDLDGCCC